MIKCTHQFYTYCEAACEGSIKLNFLSCNGVQLSTYLSAVVLFLSTSKVSIHELSEMVE